MQVTDLYSYAHLVVAAIRVWEHQKTIPPSIDEICQTLSFSPERANLICRKLHEIGIIDIVEGAYGTRLFIKNHLLVEEIPKGTSESGLEKELKKFKAAKKDYTRKIESLQAEQAEKRKNLFSEIEKKLKKGLDKT
ncbi:MAG: hypothetical protein JRI99_04915 [Deltaproteobacteria bacterium]|nr:hypothetical protein [Deltaproteobacteria bacterium]MBW2539502.1 hypothetical protein [Deltaproteobacteria bacterium]